MFKSRSCRSYFVKGAKSTSTFLGFLRINKQGEAWTPCENKVGEELALPVVIEHGFIYACLKLLLLHQLFIFFVVRRVCLLLADKNIRWKVHFATSNFILQPRTFFYPWRIASRAISRIIIHWKSTFHLFPKDGWSSLSLSLPAPSPTITQLHVVALNFHWSVYSVLSHQMLLWMQKRVWRIYVICKLLWLRMIPSGRLFSLRSSVLFCTSVDPPTTRSFLAAF